MTKPGIRVVLWACTAVAVTVAASLAIAASVGAKGSALSREDVARELADESGGPTPTGPTSTNIASSRAAGASPAAAPPTPPTTAGGTTPPAAGVPATGMPGAVDHVGTGSFGSVVVRCQDGVAVLVSWSPAPGYRADDAVRGPAATVSIRFSSDVAEDIAVTGSCDGSRATITEGPDDGGGGGGRGGRGPG